MSMIILLPDSPNGLGQLVAQISADQLNGWVDQLQEEYGSVALPKFTAQSNNDMVPVLQALGMQVAFRCPETIGTGPVADFSALTSAGVCVTSAQHNAWVHVDEIGTVAAGATTIGVGTTAARQLQFTMTMDHPFLYTIRDDDSGTLLFIGTLVNPSK
jgi:serine protease inhibitor